MRHLPSYALLLPLRLGDWPSAVINAQALAYPVVLLLLAFSPRSSRLWAFWRRYVRCLRGLYMRSTRCTLLVCGRLRPATVLYVVHSLVACTGACDLRVPGGTY